MGKMRAEGNSLGHQYKTLTFSIYYFVLLSDKWINLQQSKNVGGRSRCEGKVSQ